MNQCLKLFDTDGITDFFDFFFIINFENNQQTTKSPHFKYLMKIKLFGLSENKLFHFLGIFKKNETKSGSAK